MARTCTICQHPDREAIDKALLAGKLSNRRIAAQCDVSEIALRRHVAAGHIPKQLAKAQEANEVAKADTLLAQVGALRDKALAILDKAERAGDLKTALQGVREAKGCLELLARLQGQLLEQQAIHLKIEQVYDIVTKIRHPEQLDALDDEELDTLSDYVRATGLGDPMTVAEVEALTDEELALTKLSDEEYEKLRNVARKRLSRTPQKALS